MKPAWEIELESILAGIDKEETNDDTGWWKTSKGARFGTRKLEEVKVLIRRLTSAPSHPAANSKASGSTLST